MYVYICLNTVNPSLINVQNELRTDNETARASHAGFLFPLVPDNVEQLKLIWQHANTHAYTHMLRNHVMSNNVGNNNKNSNSNVEQKEGATDVLSPDPELGPFSVPHSLIATETATVTGVAG